MELDGLTITSTYADTSSADPIYGVYVHSTQTTALTNIVIKNCVIRHLATSGTAGVMYGIKMTGRYDTSTLERNDVRDMQSSAAVYGISFDRGATSSTDGNDNIIKENRIVNVVTATPGAENIYYQLSG